MISKAMKSDLREALDALYRVRFGAMSKMGSEDLQEVKDALFNMIAYVNLVESVDKHK